MIDNRVVGRRIAQRRRSCGLTQVQLAALMNVSHQAVSKWESGAAVPDIQTLLELTRFFGLTVEQLVGDAREESEPPVAGAGAAEEVAAGAPAREPAPVEIGEAESNEREGNKMNIQQLLQMAPYMTREAVAEIAMGLEGKLSANQIARLAPYLSPECVEALVEKHHPEFTWDSLRSLAPHMRRETVDELARAIASGRETVKGPEDSFNKTMNDIGRAFDDFGKGVDKAVRRAIRFGENMFNEVSSAINEMGKDDAEDAKVRSERARELRRRAFERALADGKWDWLGEHLSELEEGDALRGSIVARARELGMHEWIAEHAPDYIDAYGVDAAIEAGEWDWLGEELSRMDPELQRHVVLSAAKAGRFDWLRAHAGEIELGEAAPDFVRKLWSLGERSLAEEFARGRLSEEQFDAIAREADAADDIEMADRLWFGVSDAYARERLIALAEANEWARVEELLNRADGEAMEKLMELAVEQGNFDAVDFLDPYL